MPSLPIFLILLTTNTIIFIFIIYYFIKLRTKEKIFENKENKIDTTYHQIIENALNKERKILEDASNEASQILTEAHYVKSSSKNLIDQAVHQMLEEIKQTSSISQQLVHEALQKMIVDVQKEIGNTGINFLNNYQTTLEQLSVNSLNNFQQISKELETNLKEQIKVFNNSLLPSLQKELEDYKKMRLEQTNQVISHIVQEVAQEVLNKSISLIDHQELLKASLEKAKREGFFD